MKVPRKGGFLLVCNHQCLLDPMFAVIPVTRQFCFAARDGLFRVPLIGWLIRTYNSIPIKRGKPDLAAVKLCVEKLKQGYGLIIFPEGTRTLDGKISELKPGFGLLARKANVPIIPVVIDGSFECWPRHRAIPSPGKIDLIYGDPIEPEKLATFDDREFAKYLTGTLREMQTELRLKIGKQPFDYSVSQDSQPAINLDAKAAETSKQAVSPGAERYGGGKIGYLWYFMWCWLCRIFCMLFFHPRPFNLSRIPKKGGFLLLSNHQSFLDPMLNANPITRPCCFAARDTLFNVPIFGTMLHTVNAIPIKRGQADLTAMRMFVERLKDGYGLVLYPEGTRTLDGKIAEIKPGFSLLARRANVPIIPSVIDGAYECWPKKKKLFSPGKVYVNYGLPIPPEKVAELGDREFAKYLTKILRDMQTELRLKVGRKPFEYPDN
ncbi:MAG: lysophospholipid acyltransferase family protein [Phycisphaerae bacterium]